MKKLFSLLTILGVVALFTNCGGGGNIGNDNKTVTVYLRPYYLRGCAYNLFDTSYKNIQITISVDIVQAGATNKNKKDNYREYRFIRNNDDNHEPNLRFPGIEIPETGIFTVTVLVHALSCFECCYSFSCPHGSGKPFHKGNSRSFHVDDIYSDYQINVFPFYEDCL